MLRNWRGFASKINLKDWKSKMTHLSIGVDISRSSITTKTYKVKESIIQRFKISLSIGVDISRPSISPKPYRVNESIIQRYKIQIWNSIKELDLISQNSIEHTHAKAWSHFENQRKAKSKDRGFWLYLQVKMQQQSFSWNPLKNI